MAQMIIVTRKRGLLTTLATKELLTSVDDDLPASLVAPSGAEVPLSVAGASDAGAFVTNSVTPGSSGAVGASVAGAGAGAGAAAGAASSAGAGAASSAGAQFTLTRR